MHSIDEQAKHLVFPVIKRERKMFVPLIKRLFRLLIEEFLL